MICFPWPHVHLPFSREVLLVFSTDTALTIIEAGAHTVAFIGVFRGREKRLDPLPVLLSVLKEGQALAHFPLVRHYCRSIQIFISEVQCKNVVINIFIIY